MIRQSSPDAEDVAQKLQSELELDDTPTIWDTHNHRGQNINVVTGIKHYPDAVSTMEQCDTIVGDDIDALSIRKTNAYPHDDAVCELHAVVAYIQ